MSKIHAPIPVTGKHWGLDFVQGVAETDNAALADKLEGLGYGVERDAEATASAPPVKPSQTDLPAGEKAKPAKGRKGAKTVKEA